MRNELTTAELSTGTVRRWAGFSKKTAVGARDELSILAEVSFKWLYFGMLKRKKAILDNAVSSSFQKMRLQYLRDERIGFSNSVVEVTD
jgi:hypothetical protein